MALDIALEVELNGERVTQTNSRHLYWSVAQQIAHLTVNGAAMRTGDLLGSGTIFRGPERAERGSLLELSWNGAEPFRAGGRERTFLEDGDEVVLRGLAGADSGSGDAAVALAEVRGRIVGGIGAASQGPPPPGARPPPRRPAAARASGRHRRDPAAGDALRGRGGAPADLAGGRRRVVEIGVFEGSSAVVLCEVLAPDADLHLVDPFGHHPAALPEGGAATERAARRAVARAVRGSQGPSVHWHVDFSAPVAERWAQPVDLLFIDGDHSEAGVAGDWDLWSPFVVAGGTVLFHDARASSPSGAGSPDRRPSSTGCSAAAARGRTGRSPRRSTAPWRSGTRRGRRRRGRGSPLRGRLLASSPSLAASVRRRWRPATARAHSGTLGPPPCAARHAPWHPVLP